MFRDEIFIFPSKVSVNSQIYLVRGVRRMPFFTHEHYSVKYRILAYANAKRYLKNVMMSHERQNEQNVEHDQESR